MTKKEIAFLIKKLEKYRDMNLDDSSGYNPFGRTDAFWATGYINFLLWLKANNENNKKTNL